jgi:hypothetical protein
MSVAVPNRVVLTRTKGASRFQGHAPYSLTAFDIMPGKRTPVGIAHLISHLINFAAHPSHEMAVTER